LPLLGYRNQRRRANMAGLVLAELAREVPVPGERTGLWLHPACRDCRVEPRFEVDRPALVLTAPTAIAGGRRSSTVKKRSDTVRRRSVTVTKRGINGAATIGHRHQTENQRCGGERSPSPNGESAVRRRSVTVTKRGINGAATIAHRDQTGNQRRGGEHRWLAGPSALSQKMHQMAATG
jgi:hypothetical protein